MFTLSLDIVAKRLTSYQTVQRFVHNDRTSLKWNSSFYKSLPKIKQMACIYHEPPVPKTAQTILLAERSEAHYS